jgi:hypothetical protein
MPQLAKRYSPFKPASFQGLRSSPRWAPQTRRALSRATEPSRLTRRLGMNAPSNTGRSWSAANPPPSRFAPVRRGGAISDVPLHGGSPSPCSEAAAGGIRPANGGIRERRPTSSSRRTAPWLHRHVLSWSRNFPAPRPSRGSARRSLARSQQVPSRPASSGPLESPRLRPRALQSAPARNRRAQPLAIRTEPSLLPPIGRQRRRSSTRGAS